MDDPPATSPALTYRLCSRCARAVPSRSDEQYCVNDGTELLSACPQCSAPITSPYARFCTRCGTGLTSLSSTACPP